MVATDELEKVSRAFVPLFHLKLMILVPLPYKLYVFFGLMFKYGKPSVQIEKWTGPGGGKSITLQY